MAQNNTTRELNTVFVDKSFLAQSKIQCRSDAFYRRLLQQAELLRDIVNTPQKILVTADEE